MPSKDVVIRLSAKNLTKAEFDKARKQLDQLEKKAGFTNKKFGQLGKGLGRAGQQLATFNPAAAQASSLLGGFGISAGALIPVLGAVGVVGALGAMTKNLISTGVELTTLRDKTGISLEGLQKLQFQADQTNVGFNSVADSVVRLGRRLAAGLPEATKALAKLGLEVEDVLELDPAKQFDLIVAEIAKLPNEAQQSAAAMGIFGDAGLQILPLVRSDVEALAQEFEDLGGAISDDVLESGRRLDDSWTSLKRSAGLLSAEIAGPLVTSLADLVERFLESKIEGRKLQAELDALSSEQRREAEAIIGPGLGDPRSVARLKELRELGRKQIEDAKAISAEIERLNKKHNKTAEETEGVATNTEALLELEKSRTKVLRELNKIQAEGTKSLREHRIELELEAQLLTSIGDFPAEAFEVPELTTTAGTPFAQEIPIAMRAWELGVEDVTEETGLLVDAQTQYNDALQAANALAQLIGGTLGQLIGQTFAAGAALENLGKSGGLSGLFSAGKGEGSGLTGFLGGLGGLASGLGPLIGLGASLATAIAGMFGRDAQDVAQDVGRDIGATISEGLAEAILESGESAQLFLREIFEEGGLGIDRFAEEVGDLFSLFERSEITEGSLLEELGETLPILIENFGDLGEAGQAQIERIIFAAEEMNIDLGETGDILERLAKGIPEITLEGLAAELGITTEAARELADALGVNVQTDIQRLADDLDVPVSKIRELGAALEEEFGVGIDGIQSILDLLGIDIDQLADKLGVELPEAAQTAAGAVEGVETGEGGIDSAVFGDSAGRVIAGHLVPGQRQISVDIGTMRSDMARLPDAIARAIRDTQAQAT